MTNDQSLTNEKNDQQINPPVQTEVQVNENEQVNLSEPIAQNEPKATRSLLYYIVLALLIVVLLIGGIGSYLVYPFSQKLSGSWVSEDQKMTLTSHGKQWTLAIPNYRRTKGMTLVYKGVWQAAGLNKYDGKQVKLYLSMDKAAFQAEELAALEKKSELYTVSEETKEAITVRYTKKGLQQIQSQSDVPLENIVHISLENFSWHQKKNSIYLNSRYFSEERIVFKKEK